ncbi:MAG TPA: ECF transporter S component [Candidatus Bathyarchaeia archaeon]|nr:ECF transporter S component [Candidatus Bathyarchaeia archaeon]
MSTFSISEKDEWAEKGKTTPVRTIAIMAVFTALVFVVTQYFWVPISAVPGQRFDAGDIIIFISAWTFGPEIGGFAGGVGSSLSDALVGGAPYWPFTLVIKGLEGYIAGLVLQRGQRWGLKLSWLFASSVMVGGYFLTNALFIGLLVGVNSDLNPGPFGALLEVPFDLAQVLAGGVIARPISRYLRNALPYSGIGNVPSKTGSVHN